MFYINEGEESQKAETNEQNDVDENGQEKIELLCQKDDDENGQEKIELLCQEDEIQPLTLLPHHDDQKIFFPEQTLRFVAPSPTRKRQQQQYVRNLSELSSLKPRQHQQRAQQHSNIQGNRRQRTFELKQEVEEEQEHFQIYEGVEQENEEMQQQHQANMRLVALQFAEQKRQEEDEMRELVIEKKELIHIELRKIMVLMEVYHVQASKLSRWDSITKATVTGASAVAAIGLYIGVDKKSSELNDAFYYISLTCTSVAAVLGQLTNSWNLSERAHNNTTTYRGLHNLHDFVSFQLVRDHLTSQMIDSLLDDIQNRLLLIRDSAERGTYQPRSRAQRDNHQNP